VCCSVLQRIFTESDEGHAKNDVAACCRVLRYVAIFCSALAQCPTEATLRMKLQCAAVCCSVLQCVAAHFTVPEGHAKNNVVV